MSTLNECNSLDAKNLSSADIACPVIGPVVSSLTTTSQDGRTISTTSTPIIIDKL